ncbi:MAG: NUDIX hydrolase [Microgenomates group bacterium]
MKKIYPVVVGVVEKNNKFLLTKRQSPKKEWNKWQFPGGEVEFGESLHQALKREMKEEIGCEIKIIEKQPKIFEIFRLSDNFHAIFFVYLCQLTDSNCKIKINREASEYRWLSLKEIYTLDSLEGTKEITSWLNKMGFKN